MKYLVTSIGSMSGEAVLRAMCLLPNVEIVGCNMHPREWIANSRLVHRFYQLPSTLNSRGYISRLREICMRESVDYVVPLTDPELDLLSESRTELGDDTTICISPHVSIRLSRDKLELSKAFVDHKRIRTIPTVELGEIDESDLGFPLLAKPRSGRSSEGHVSIPNSTALKFWREQLRGQDYVLQPFHLGDVCVVDVVRQSDGRKAVAMSRLELLRTKNGAGMTVQMLPNHLCASLAIEAAEILNLHGCINMEFLIVDGTPLLMDVNPRFSAGVAFSQMSGYDMVANHLRCFQGHEIESCLPPRGSILARSFVEHLM